METYKTEANKVKDLQKTILKEKQIFDQRKSDFATELKTLKSQIREEKEKHLLTTTALKKQHLNGLYY